MVYLTCAVIGLGGRGVIKTWSETCGCKSARLYMLTSDLTSLVPQQFSQCTSALGTFLYIYIQPPQPLRKTTWIEAPSKEKRARLHRLSQNGNPYNILWSERKNSESCQGGL